MGSSPETGSDRPGVGSLLAYTIPFHLSLPWLLWALDWLHPDAPIVAFLALHSLFPVVLVLTFRYWKNEFLELVGLVAINHVATFLSYAGMSWVRSIV